MKMKMVTALFVLSLGTTASFAQTGASDGSRFGHGEDSILHCFQISPRAAALNLPKYLLLFNVPY